jgi:signal transduction histidine kinase
MKVRTGQEKVLGNMTSHEPIVSTIEELNTGNEGVRLAEMAHDVRNLVTALGVYCDLLNEPGVLSAPYAHYGRDLRMVATASRNLAEKLSTASANATVDTETIPRFHEATTSRGKSSRKYVPHQSGNWRPLCWEPPLTDSINNLSADLLANRNLLAALAGPAVELTIDAENGEMPVKMTGENLTRVLVNLVKNAAEAMNSCGRIAISLREIHAGPEMPPRLLMSVDDSGPGIPESVLKKIFEPGYSTQPSDNAPRQKWPSSHHGLGLSSSRSIVEAAGGSIHAFNRSQGGARLEIELPVRKE